MDREEIAGAELRPHCQGQTRHILVCLDGSPLGERVLSHAIALAVSLDVRMTLLRVLEEKQHTLAHEPVDPLDWEMRRTEASMYLDRVQARVAERGVQVEVVLAQGHPAQQILGLVAEGGIDLVALATHGEKSLEDWTLSGTAEKVLAQAGVSILLVPAFQPKRADDGGPRYARILVPLDCSPRSECVFGPLLKIASTHQSEVLLVHATPPAALTYSANHDHIDRELVRSLGARNERVASEYLESTKRDLEKRSISARVHLELERDARESLEELAESEAVDLIAITAHGTTGCSTRRYGAITRDLIARVQVPLLIVQDLPTRPRHRLTTAPARAGTRECDVRETAADARP